MTNSDDKHTPLVYIAGPLTKPDPIRTSRHAIAVHLELLELKIPSICPHLSTFAHFHTPKDYEQWLWLDFEHIKRCDLLLRLIGDSPGADREVVFARELGLPIIFTHHIEPAVIALQVKELLTATGAQNA